MLFFFFPVISLPVPTHAEQPHYAALLTVTHDGLEIRRAGTTDWLPLSIDAQAPFNTGDALRTDNYGRAYLSFLQDSSILVLPRSTFELVEFTYSPNLNLSIRMTGHAIQALNTETGLYRLETPRLVINSPSTLLAVWDHENEPSAVTTAKGDLKVSIGSEEFTVKEGQGLFDNQINRPAVADLNMPLTAPHLEGELLGCPGEIQTVDDLNINIRVGTGFQSDVIGSIANKSVVRVMATNEHNTWYRIQAFSGFGWIRQSLVKSACENLPVLPDNSREYNRGLQNIAPIEYALLEPFYGSGDEDLWFYLSFLPAG